MTSYSCHVNNQLENRLRVLVGAGQVGLRVAQEAIATNWFAAYSGTYQPRLESLDSPR